MKRIIKSAQICFPTHELHGKTTDLIIEGGIITSIGDDIQETADWVSTPGVCISPGWFDMRVHFGEPGFEHCETIESGLKAAEAGGMTGLALMPGTNPPVDNKAAVEFIKSKSKGELVEVAPIGMASVKGEGKEMSEMFDLHKAGAKAFSDHIHSIENPDLLKRLLQYASQFDGLIMQFAHDSKISGKGMVHEGAISTSLGLKSIPDLAEIIRINRDIMLSEYTDHRLHLGPISLGKSVELIKRAKQEGLKITCSVNAYNLVFNDESLLNFDSNFKVLPPLRTESDRQALITGIIDGTIDCIVSDHYPQDVEQKHREFDHAGYGMIGVQTMYSMLNTYLGDLVPLDNLMPLISSNPREILNLEPAELNVGSIANLTLFSPQQEWTYDLSANKSLSSNSPILGKTLKGKINGVANNGKFKWFD